MNAKPKLVTLEKSRRKAPEAKRLGPVPDDQRMEVSIYLQPRSGTGATLSEVVKAGGQLSPEEFEARHGADPKAIAAVLAYARSQGLTVRTVDPRRRVVTLAGPARAMRAAFQPDRLDLYEHEAHGQFVGRTGSLRLPQDLVPHVAAVVGLDQRPIARPHFRRGAAATAGGAFDPPQIATLYQFPTGVDGAGQSIGILELGGGYGPADLDAFFSKLGLKTPTVTSVAVDAGHNNPGDPSGADAEVLLDIEVAGAVAPGAEIAVYFADNTDQGFLDSVTTAIHDPTNHPSVLSISWGSDEANWTAQAMDAMDQAFQSAAVLGVTVCVASGDNGAVDNSSDGSAQADFPASSPYVLACGGTHLTARPFGETVWNGGDGGASGGGVSLHFPLPDWQGYAGVPVSLNGGKPGRGVPDVAGDADPATGYNIVVDGQREVVGGTSAVAPLWAGLIALANQANAGHAGFINPALYQKTTVFNDVTKGNNRIGGVGYDAGSGWDPCTGWGSPNGQKVTQAIAPVAA